MEGSIHSLMVVDTHDGRLARPCRSRGTPSVLTGRPLVWTSRTSSSELALSESTIARVLHQRRPRVRLLCQKPATNAVRSVTPIAGRGRGGRGAETGDRGTTAPGAWLHTSRETVVSFVTSGVGLAGLRVQVPLRSSGSLDQAGRSRFSRRKAPSRERNARPGLPGVCTLASGARNADREGCELRAAAGAVQPRP